MRNNDGLTLIELIVTLTIMSLLLAIAVPRVDLNFGYMEKMINEFAMDVRNVQMENMKIPSAGYEIKIYSNKYYVRKNMNIEKTVNFKDGYTIYYNNGDSISFTYDGEPKKAGTFTITDTRTSKIKQVSIVPVTGRTIILE
ncbi:MAG: prepilin-type N-terminal cleavage/methylation domain-containing protein [Tissierellia bacterium]|nr:prepilin-type N-terminal cleavage/methylation domain-containing protein [Tissierellia bacterium]